MAPGGGCPVESAHNQRVQVDQPRPGTLPSVPAAFWRQRHRPDQTNARHRHVFAPGNKRAPIMADGPLIKVILPSICFHRPVVFPEDHERGRCAMAAAVARISLAGDNQGRHRRKPPPPSSPRPPGTWHELF